MSATEYLVPALWLAYWVTAHEMVTFHSAVNRPAYVRGSTLRRFIGGLLWPFVSKLNNELGWFFTTFAANVILFAIIFAATSSLLPAVVCALAIVIIRPIPRVRNILIFPAALICATLWRFIAEPMGASVPIGIDDMGRISSGATNREQKASGAKDTMSRWKKFLIATCIVNTALFTVADIIDVPVWKLIALEVILFCLYVFQKTLRSPAQKLANQALSAGWIHIGSEKDENGYRDNIFQKGLIRVRISYADGCIYALGSRYDNFSEVEERLGTLLSN